MMDATGFGQFALVWQRWDQLNAFVKETANVVQDAKGIASNTRKALLKNTADTLARVQELRETGRLGIQLQQGTLTFTQWDKLCRLYWDQSVSDRQTAGETALTADRVFDELVVPSMEEIRDDAKTVVADVKAVGSSVADNFKPVLTLVVVGLVAIAVIKVWR